MERIENYGIVISYYELKAMRASIKDSIEYNEYKINQLLSKGLPEDHISVKRYKEAIVEKLTFLVSIDAIIESVNTSSDEPKEHFRIQI